MIAELTALDASTGSDGFVLTVRFDPAPGTVAAATWSYRVDDSASAVTDRSVLPALPAALVLACRLSQDLRVVEPLPPAVHRGARAVAAQLAAWYGWRPAELIAPMAEDPVVPARARRPRGRGVLFTRGVDSWGTVLRLLEAAPGERVTHLIAVDNEVHVPASVREAALADTRRTADELGLPLLVVRTDVRAAIDPHTDWGSDTHGSVFAGIGWLLRRSLDQIVISPTNSGDLLCPWGSHPDLEPAWSLADLAVEHLEDGEPRWARLARIGSDPRVVRSLQSCWQGSSERNCGACEKCLRLRSTLEVLGLADAYVDRFDVHWDPHRIDELPWSNAQAWCDLVDCLDLAGLRADPLRQRWERVPRRSVHGRAGADRPLQPRLPVDAPEELRPAVGRHLARLGLRVDHGPGPGPADAALIVRRDERTPVATVRLGGADGPARPLAELRLEDLLGLLEALGASPDAAVAFASHDRLAQAVAAAQR